MNETSVDGATMRDSVAAHVEELIAAGWTEYRLLALVAESAPGAERPVLCAAVISMLEILRLEEVRPGTILLDSGRALLRSEPTGAGMRFRSWQACLAAARPHRGTLQDVCRDFPQWVEGIGEAHCAAWCELLSVLLEVHKRAGIKLIPDLKQDVNELAATGAAAGWFEFWQRYLPVTLSDNLQALLGWGYLWHHPDALTLASRLEEVCPPEKAETDEAAQEFLATAGKAMKALPVEVRIPCLQLLLNIAGSSLDSAVHVADRLPRTLAALDPMQHGAYVAVFSGLVRQVGIISIGFGLGALRGRFAAGQAASVQAFAEVIGDIATRYGAQAAVDFMERKTRASQECWSAPAGKKTAISASA